jgi:hypothetical protein
VIDLMPGNHGCCNGGRDCCRGSYLLYNWPGREHEPVSRYVDSAMEYVEREWDALSDEEKADLVSRYHEHKAAVAAWRSA